MELEDPDPNEIAEMFSHITVEDFIRETSAESVENLDGRTNFDEFTELLVTVCVEQLEQNQFFAFAVMNTETQQKFFRPDDDETAFHFADRLHREAAQMSATWLFTAMFAPSRTYPEGADLSDINPNDVQQVKAALDAGDLKMSVCWYSHAIDEGRQRSGMVHVTDGSIEKIEGRVEPQHNPFHQVLGDSDAQSD